MKTLLDNKAAIESAIEALKAMYPKWFTHEDAHGYQDLKALEAALEDVNKQLLVQRGFELVKSGKYTNEAAVTKRINDISNDHGIEAVQAVLDLKSKFYFAASGNLSARCLNRNFLMDDDSYAMIKGLPEPVRSEVLDIEHLIVKLFAK